MDVRIRVDGSFEWEATCYRAAKKPILTGVVL